MFRGLYEGCAYFGPANHILRQIPPQSQVNNPPSRSEYDEKLIFYFVFLNLFVGCCHFNKKHQVHASSQICLFWCLNFGSITLLTENTCCYFGDVFGMLLAGLVDMLGRFLGKFAGPRWELYWVFGEVFSYLLGHFWQDKNLRKRTQSMNTYQHLQNT